MKITRSLAVGVGLAVLAPLAAPASAAPAPDAVLTNGRAFIVSQQQADGGFETVGFPGFETPDAVAALAGLAQVDVEWDGAAARTAVTALTNSGGKNPLDNLDDYADTVPAGDTPAGLAGRAAKIAVLAAQPLRIDLTDFDPSNDSAEPVDLAARIAAVKQSDGTYAMGANFNGVLYIALVEASVSGVTAELIGQIKAAQRADGSWNYAGNQDPNISGDVDTAALALTALARAGVPTSDPVVAKGLTYLADQHDDATGAWLFFGGADPSTTSLAVTALSAFHLDPTTSAWKTTYASGTETGPYASPVAWLRARQAANGRFPAADESFGVNTVPTSQTLQILGRSFQLAPDRDGLVYGLTLVLATPANATEVSRDAGLVPSDALGTNPSITAGRAAAAKATVNSDVGRQAAAADLFQQAFGRNIDASGRTYWSTKLKTITRPQMLSALTGSTEFFRRAGSTAPTFVDAVYQSVLGRGPDAAGRAFWIAKLNAGSSPDSIARSLVASTEYRRRTVDQAYASTLDVAPDAAGRAYWTDKLATTRVEVLLVSLASSRAFYDRYAD